MCSTEAQPKQEVSTRSGDSCEGQAFYVEEKSCEKITLRGHDFDRLFAHAIHIKVKYHACKCVRLDDTTNPGHPAKFGDML